MQELSVVRHSGGVTQAVAYSHALGLEPGEKVSLNELQPFLYQEKNVQHFCSFLGSVRNMFCSATREREREIGLITVR